MEQKEIENLMKEAMNDRYQGKYPEALDKLDAVIKELAESDEEWAKLKIGEAMHQLGVTLQNAGKDYKAALFCLWRAIAYRKAIHDNIGLAYSCFQIPMCKLARGDRKEDVLPDFQNAKLRIQIAVSLLEGTKEVKTLGDMYQNLAYISQLKRNYREAVLLYARALAFRKKAGDLRGEGLTHARLAECNIELINLPFARSGAEESLKIFREIGDIARIKQVEKTLREIEEQEELERDSIERTIFEGRK